MKNILLILCLLLCQQGFAQYAITGKVIDAKETLIGVNLVLTNTKTQEKRYEATNQRGVFKFRNLPAQTYTIKASYVGYADRLITIELAGENQDIVVQLSEKANELGEVKIVAKTPTAIQKGDTLQLNANAYKTNANANAEELLQKMPGITVENGTLKAHGETVQQVYVDGKPFFGDDPMTAIRNLPADAIDKVEVFDRQSDQSQFTGINDGNTSKTINIITRIKNGEFGKGTIAAGTNDTYLTGGSLNIFKGDQRMTFVGLSNNVNQQNFSSQDLLGVSAGNGNFGGSRGGSGGGGGGRGGGGGAPGGGGGGFGGNPSDNFLIGQQAGISKTNSFGFNFSDTWAKKLVIRGSYFFNNGNNNNYELSNRQYFVGNNANQLYRDTMSSNSQNYNNRINLRLEYTIDEKNSIIFTPRINTQNNYSTSLTQGATFLISNELLNKTRSNPFNHSSGYNINNDILLRHRFEKRGRTLSLNIGLTVNNKDGNGSQISQNSFYGVISREQKINQITNSFTDSYQLSGNMVFTEPIAHGMGTLQFNYNINYSKNSTNKDVFRLNPATEKYTTQDSLLSNKYNSDFVTNRPGIGLMIRGEKTMFNANIGYQFAQLTGTQVLPQNSNIQNSFNNVMPSLMFDYRVTNEKRFRMFYRTSTNMPSVNQLQNVINNSNPLFLSTGNPNLKQEFSHNLMLRYTATKPSNARNFMAMLNMSSTLDNISTSTIIADRETVINGIRLGQGAQLTMPVNLSGTFSTRGTMTYGTPISPIKCNLNLTTNLGYSQSPGLVNNQLNYSNSYSASQGLVLGSNISKEIDFTLGYTFAYNKAENSIQPQLNSTYYVQSATARLNYTFAKYYILQSDLTYSGFKGLSSTYDQQFTLWGLGFGRKFLKNQSGELKISVFDLLDQNNSISRNLTSTYLEDVRSLVLKKYFMLTFNYYLKHYK